MGRERAAERPGDQATDGSRRSRAHNYSISPIATISARRFGAVWLAALAALAVLWPLLTAGLINEYSRADSNFINALYLRKDIALREHPPAGAGRVVIVGGSDALFGIDAAQIQRALGVPTVNYATHAGLGIEYLLDRARRALRPGDTALLSLAYGMWVDPDGAFEDIAFAYFTSYDKAYYRRLGLRRMVRTLYSVPLSSYWPSLEQLVQYWRNRHAHLERMYDVAHIGPDGDLRMSVPGQRDYFQFRDLPMPQALPVRGAAAVRRFSAWAHRNNIRLLYTWPNISRPTHLTEDSLRPSAALLGLFAECRIEPIDVPSDNVFPPEWFFDTDKHLNSTGRRIRTQALIGRLAEALGPEAPNLTEAPWFIMAGPNAGLRPVADLPDGPVRFKYLSPVPDHPQAVSPAQVARAVAAGRTVWYDDRHVEPLLAEAGLVGSRELRLEQSPAQWLSPWRDHLLVVVRPDADAWPAASLEGVPVGLAEALGGRDPVALLLGTGRYARVNVRLGPGKRRAFDLPSVVGESVPPMQLDVQAPPADRPQAPLQNVLRINGRDLAPAGRGLRIVAIDPRRSSVTGEAAFASPQAKAIVAQRFRVVPGTRPVWRDVPLVALTQAGPFPARTWSDASGAWMQSSGTVGYRPSVVGVDLAPYLAERRALTVRLRVRGPVGTLVEAAVSTDRPEAFAFIPERLLAHCDGAARTIYLRIVPRADASWDARDTAVAGLQAQIGAAPVCIEAVAVAVDPF